MKILWFRFLRWLHCLNGMLHSQEHLAETRYIGVGGKDGVEWTCYINCTCGKRWRTPAPNYYSAQDRDGDL